jgi:thiol:disulfide interchange protein DsbC
MVQHQETEMTVFNKSFSIFLLTGLILLTLFAPVWGYQFIPPRNIVSKQKLPIKDFHFIRTQEGLTYLISIDGRYVFQGALFDVWNGEQLESMDEMTSLSDRIRLDYIGLNSKKMFTLNLGTGPKEVFVFADPECGICHDLIRKIRESKIIQKDYLVRIVVMPVLKESSLEKSKRLFVLAKDNPKKAIDVLINNAYQNGEISAQKYDGIEYNQLISKALSIYQFPYIINSQGRIHIGLPEEIQLFLLKK